ncbi:MAG TPA: RNA polymerase sigma factor [Myxococcales bacterium]|nr:RNA polymerase sigma factor [Myxococcales bacterium]
MAGTGRPRARGGQECPLDALSDEELLANYFAVEARDDKGIWVQELFRRHYPKVIGWCLRMTSDREEACDLAQTIFAKAYRHLGSFRGQSKVSTWLYSITRSECMNHLKARARRPPSAGEEGLTEVPDCGARPPDATLEQQAWTRLVHSLLDEALDETEKKVFTLHYGDEVPLDAITRLLGLSNRSGAKAFIVSARRKLKRAARRWRGRVDLLDV